MLVFYANRFKSLNKGKVTLLAMEVSSKGGSRRREFINETGYFIIVRKLISFQLKVSNKILKFMKLIIDRFVIKHHEFIEGKGGESFNSSIVEAIFFLQCCPQFFGTVIFIIMSHILLESALRIL